MLKGLCLFENIIHFQAVFKKQRKISVRTIFDNYLTEVQILFRRFLHTSKFTVAVL